MNYFKYYFHSVKSKPNDYVYIKTNNIKKNIMINVQVYNFQLKNWSKVIRVSLNSLPGTLKLITKEKLFLELL